MKKIFPILLFVCLLSLSKAQTFVSGGVFTSTVWAQSNSPYIVTGTVVVFPGVTLTIQPGVTIKFNANAILEVRGKCEAIGNVNDTIVFTSNLPSPSAGAWTGIRLIGTSTPTVANQLTMEYCKGMYADHFVDLDIAYYGPYNFKHCYFAHNNAVNLDGGLPTVNFDHCHFVSNQIGLDYPQFGGRVSHSYFINNVVGTKGFDRVDSCYFASNTGTACVPYGPTVGNKIVNNNIGVHGMYNSVNNSFRNNEVTNNNIGVQVETYFNGSITFTGNTICNNSTWDLKMFTNNNADLSNNCWCTSNVSLIQSKIYDGFTNASLGLVNLSPLASICSTNAMNVKEYEVSNTHLLIPNPFNESAFIILNDASYGICELAIYDAQGKIVRKEKVEVYDKIPLQRNELKNGLYLYVINKETRVLAKGKFVISD